MLDYDFEQSIGFWIISAANDYQRVLNDELAPQGITFRQCQVLGCLAWAAPLSQSDLAERMRIEPPTLVGILDRMERDGWIERIDCDSDRRRKLIRPLPAAKPVWSKIAAAARRVRAQATAGLSPSELETLKQLMGIVRSNLEKQVARTKTG